MWQTLVGVGEIDDERLTAYLTKAMRESKQHTSWLDSDPEYEARVLGLAHEANRPGGAATPWSAPLSSRTAGRCGPWSSGRSCCSSPSPGCRTPTRAARSSTCRWSTRTTAGRSTTTTAGTASSTCGDHDPRDLDDEKLLVTHKALTLRRELRGAFGDDGLYEPLTATSRHLVGFVRGGEAATLVTRAPTRLEVAGGWGDATVELPEGLWRDELTGALHGGADNLCADVFAAFPVALLRRVHRP